ncbi:flagellar biosynthetic protein FliO [Pseudoalteromonas tunicata]|jgi:flagellar protein FliO/FliZ|uniref:Flagellar protein n=1 Tax=Pseudoalteromonas tunicata D2 TaxID=87626 RepID=A4C6C5_9GAMM|nr:flagellar biosynthetic protein FliO [Pseudoalteromonas tunicata]ATC95504.1 flagellar protein FliO/FliZ [Pseudoalteromonas tunicata]AXT31078.1 flagellar biosynthetic protein FliO [Pseudoalteromonas tunicata]EAR29529.1 putative flagellar protein [Pseudoalteromonas tunicata D2]MDP4982541.1 flagellar biosynthetic protein FliO [Pseudoalteromonas tunicata]MDP5212433.1 flagellar biosynthetic protein FliO [Pseudoalteromonas tunicata]
MKLKAALFISLFSAPALAETTPVQSLMSVALSLGLVIVIIVILAMLVKRLNPHVASQDEFKVVRTIALGTRERLLVIEIDNKQHLLGVTPHNINYLYELQEPLTAKEMPVLAKSFSQLLNPNNKKT